MLKLTEKARIETMTDQANQIKIGVILTEWELSIIVNSFEGKGCALEMGNRRVLKLTYHILKILKGFINKLIRQQVNMDENEVWLHVMSKTKNSIFILRGSLTR